MAVAQLFKVLRHLSSYCKGMLPQSRKKYMISFSYLPKSFNSRGVQLKCFFTVLAKYFGSLKPLL